MAEENFDDDIFADLYEDEAPAATTTAPAAETKPQPPVANGSSSAPQDESTHAADPNGDDHGKQEEHEEDDDEIDFNLGGPTDYSAPQEHHEQHDRHHGGGVKEDGKMFIGGLNWETTDESLKEYFSQFGEVLECTVMRDGATGRSRGFGFLTFKDAKCVNVVMVKEHYLDGKIIDPKRAIPRDEQERTSKIFVGGVSQEATEQDFKEYFMQFGRVVDATLMMDKDTGRPRGFGFVTFDSEAAVDACLNVPLEILGKPIEVKKAQPRGNVREDEDRGGRGRFQKHGQDQQQQGNYNQNMGGMQGVQGMGGMNGMSPQVMAQYMARMQQYFMMMQQNMAMGGAGRGMNPAMMNPAMMNPMMMQQMQAMQAAQQQGASGARSQSPQSPAVPNPAMMNPMLMQQMAAMQGGQQQGGRQGSAGSQGYNPYDQQQGYDGGHQNNQNRQRRQGSQQANNFQQQPQQFGGNQTSWEGMYDDVPQPGQHGGGRGGFKGHQNQGGHSGPTPAPPAGAPTGPKNAGRPGANYRGGGRGGRGGYHPYAR